MEEKLAEALEARRSDEGLSYERWGEVVGISYTNLFRFVKGEVGLSRKSIRILAADALNKGDKELLGLLAKYALGLPQIDISLN